MMYITMERRLVKQGRNALTITLPAKWLKSHGLNAGDAVHVEPRNQEVKITVKQGAERKETEVDIRENEKSMMWHKIIAAYIEGYDKITILHDQPGFTQKLSHDLIGIVIEEHTETRTVLTSIITVPEKNIEPLIRRTTHMLQEQGRILEGITLGKNKYEDIKAQERLLDNNIYYCLRYLNKYFVEEKAYKYFLLCSTIEQAGDQISIIAKHIGKNKELAGTIRKTLETYNSEIHKGNLKTLYTELRKFRNSIKKEGFAEGLTYILAETLYNNIGYLTEEKK